ncbi:MAG: sugar ABC transporter substrate-binding protein [Clostridiales bacterium]
MRFMRFFVICIFLFNLVFMNACSNKNTKESNGKTVVKLAVWDYNLAQEYKEAIKEFESQNKDISIKVTDISSKEYTDKVTIMLAGGEDTDVIAIKDMPSYSGFVSKKQIMSLDDKISKDKIDIEPYKGILEDIKLDEKLYQLPYRSDIWILYYNKEIFDNAKESYPTNNLTFNKFQQISKNITSGKGNDKIYGTYIHTWKSCIMNWAVANGNETLIDGQYDFLKPAYDIFLKIQNEDKSALDYATAKTQNSNYLGQFESGKVGMLLMGSWFIGQLISDKKDGKHTIDWGIAKAPHFDNGEEGMTFGNITGLAINEKSSRKDEAWEFVKFMGTESGAECFAKRGVFPAYRTDNIMKTYLSVDGFPKDNEGALDTKSVKLEFPPSKNGAEIDKILQEEHELIMIGENKVDKGIDEMEKRVKEVD